MGSYEQTKLLRSTIKWAQKECYKWIRAHKGCSKQTAVELFIDKMDDCSAKSNAQSVIFSIAKDVAVSILDEIIYVEEWRKHYE